MRIALLIAVSTLSVAAVPAIAQDAMASHDQMTPGSMMKMSAADTHKMASCNAMSHDKMMKNAGCAKLMKAHPDMMKSDTMMAH